MNVKLSSDQEALVKQQLDSGRFESAGAVVAEAFELLRAQEQLRREVRKGFDQIERGEYIDVPDGDFDDLAHDIEERGMRRLENDRATLQK